MTYEDAMSFLDDSSQYGSVLGLESMKLLLDRLGNPQDELKFVHIAGTNGKGSTAAYVASIMATAGYRVGRYISPSVLGYREKIQISQRPQTEDNIVPFITEYSSECDIASCLEEIKAAIEGIMKEGNSHPTVFEIETAMAFLYFLKKDCNLVVLEVGLGGRLDATNVINTVECAVITSISMDHMHILGNTLEQIAFEKAGIIKPRIKVVSYDQHTSAKEVIKSVCKENNANLTSADFKQILLEDQSIDGTCFSYEDLKHMKISMLGFNQVENAVVSILAVKSLIDLGYHVSKEDIYTGLLNTKWQGRFEILKTKPYFLVDGAHNEDAAASLAYNLQLYFPKKRMIFIVGVLADKDYNTVLRNTGHLAELIITITPDNSRGLKSDLLADTAKEYCRKVIDAGKVSEAVKKAYENAYEEDVIIAFGSLSYLKEVYDELGIYLID